MQFPIVLMELSMETSLAASSVIHLLSKCGIKGVSHQIELDFISLKGHFDY